MPETNVLPMPTPASGDERAQAEALARRYHAEFVDLKNFKIQHELLRTVPVELMFRYNFVPIEQTPDALVIAVSDPSRLMVVDEIAGLLGSRIVAIADAYDTITSDRTYKKGRAAEEAMAELERCAGTQFDAKLVRLFVERLRQLPNPILDVAPAPEDVRA